MCVDQAGQQRMPGNSMMRAQRAFSHRRPVLRPDPVAADKNYPAFMHGFAVENAGRPQEKRRVFGRRAAPRPQTKTIKKAITRRRGMARPPGVHGIV